MFLHTSVCTGGRGCRLAMLDELVLNLVRHSTSESIESDAETCSLLDRSLDERRSMEALFILRSACVLALFKQFPQSLTNDTNLDISASPYIPFRSTTSSIVSTEVI